MSNFENELQEFRAKKYDIPENMANYSTIAQVQNSLIGSITHSNMMVMSPTAKCTLYMNLASTL